MNDDPVFDGEQLELAITAQEGLRGVMPDEIVDAAVAALRQRLNASRSEVQRRRQVTVLFADLSGFTSLSSRLDAEVVAGFMNELWFGLDKVITDHGGRVDKYIGDATPSSIGSFRTSPATTARDATRLAIALVKWREASTGGSLLSGCRPAARRYRVRTAILPRRPQ